MNVCFINSSSLISPRYWFDMWASFTNSLTLYALNCFNTLRPRRDRWHFADLIFKCVFLNENEWISLRISLKFVPKVRINNIPSLVQIMAWRRSGDKPLSEPMMVSLPTHICVTRPQWVKETWEYGCIFITSAHWQWDDAGSCSPSS